MKYAIINNEIVENIIIADEIFAKQNQLILANDAEIGWRYYDNRFHKPEPDIKVLSNSIRRERDEKLLESDIKVLSDRWAKMTEKEKTAWSEYRQQLRDITVQEKFPYNVTWPELPV